MSNDPADLESQFEDVRTGFRELTAEVQRAIVGYDEMLRHVLIAVFGGGHILLEGVPGLGKTYLVKVLSRVLGMSSGRVQCTPDLMPADILGTHIVTDDGTGKKTFVYEKGPVFTNLLLVDEINRATPKTQAALLEVMQEQSVTAGGEHFVLPSPFFVLATQNPLEMEGTYPLPEAQLDRFFFKLHVPFPNAAQLVEISKRTTGYEEPELKVVMEGERLIELQRLVSQVPVAEPMLNYAACLVLATHPEQQNASAKVQRFVSYGSSPRGMQTLIRGARVNALLEGRTAVSIADIKAVAVPALRHRVLLNFEGEAESLDVDGLVGELLAGVATPGAEAA
ncbi:MAG: MoxR family ATPase [Planctomycetes bacterium]|nr:MoxR family ATPase [Planctomycetota bacterium]